MANSCETCKHYEVEAYNEPCNSCRFRNYDVPTKWEPAGHYKPDTNADRIRAMSDEELAENLCDKRLTKEMWLKWLKQPAEREDK